MIVLGTVVPPTITLLRRVPGSRIHNGSVRVWSQDTGECIAMYSDAEVGDSFSSLALLGPSAGPGLHLAATTIRGRVLVLRLALEAKTLQVVACTPAPLPSA